MAVVEALGFLRGGVTITRWRDLFSDLNDLGQKKRGAYNPFTERNQFELAFRIYEALLEGSKLLYAYQEAANRCNVSQRSAELAWAKYRDYFPKPIASPRRARK
jgi:hypothetical protein